MPGQRFLYKKAHPGPPCSKTKRRNMETLGIVPLIRHHVNFQYRRFHKISLLPGKFHFFKFINITAGAHSTIICCICQFLCSLGGSIAVYGEKSDGSDWNVGIQDPNGKDGEVLGGIKVKSGTSISTSGDYEKTFTDKKTGKRYFHILDSKTGYSVKTDIRSCTIICDSGLNADGLSTACFSLGVKKSQKLLKKYNAKAVFVDKNNKVYVSDGVEFTLTAKDYKILNL